MAEGLAGFPDARSGLAAAPAADAWVQPVASYRWGDGGWNGERLARHVTSLRAGKEPHAFTLRTGTPADGDDLVGREAVIADAVAALVAGRSLHLMAPRRYGKTSLLRRLARVHPGALAIDAENLNSVAGFAVALASQALLREVPGLRALPELVAWPAASASVPLWCEARAALHKDISLSPSAFLRRVLAALRQDGTVVLIDEFSRFLLAARDDTQLPRGLDELRGARTAGLRIVVAGSSGLRAFIRSSGLQHHFDDLDPLPVGPLDEPVAALLVEELCYGHGRAPTREVVHSLLEHIGAPVPYFVQALVHHSLAEAWERLDKDAVDRAYRLRLLDLEGNESFKPFRLRERGYPDAWRKPASGILGRLARAGTVPEPELRAVAGDDFAALLAALTEDYDLVEEAGAWSFRSKVLRERWTLAEAWLAGD
jgi:hypothetical protein